MNASEARCELCGEPMPKGESMFKFHGYSGPCPKPPLPRQRPEWITAAATECSNEVLVGAGIETFARIIEQHFKSAQ